MNFDEEAWLHAVEKTAHAAGLSMQRLVKTIAALRHPETGCPWDLQQDHRSLRRFMLEEAYEAAEVMLLDSPAELVEELGDVLLQVVLNAQLASEKSEGDIVDIIEGLDSKMRRRHPHVFAPQNDQNLGPGDVKRAWEAIKKKEKAERVDGEVFSSSTSTFSKEEKVIPALTQAYKIGKKAKAIHFDWGQAEEVLQQLKQEITELESEIRLGQTAAVESELGDVFFTLAQLSRHLGFEPESAAQLGNVKFLKRFARVEALARDKGHTVESLLQSELEDLWQKAKQEEKK